MAPAEIAFRIHELPTGQWAAPEAAAPMLASIREGLILRDLLIGGVVSSELLGPGDLALLGEDSDAQVPQHTRWTVVAPARIGVIDLAEAANLPAWPRIADRLVHASAAQLRRSSELIAIGHMPRVEDRVLAMFWHFAPRFGRVTPDGVAIPVQLTHAVIGQLIGARRPTVSLDLRRLEEEGLVRRQGATWIVEPGCAEAVGDRHVRAAATEVPSSLPALELVR